MQGEKTRVLTLQDGNTITEKLGRQDNEGMSVRYSIADMSVLDTLEHDESTDLERGP